MSKIEVNKIEEQCGSTLTVGGGAGKTVVVCGATVTIGRCGGSVALASGATQTGFGQAVTGVEYCTTAKTSPFTAVSQKGYFVNTTSGAVTVTLPASPSAGDVVAIADYANTFGANNVTICRNSSKIDGQCSNATLNQSSVAQTLVYVDATKGWKSVQKQESGLNIPSSFIVATGGTETTCGDFKIHTFTSDGTFNITSAGTPNARSAVDFLIVGGGGGGGYYQAGGGGAGGYRESKNPFISGCWSASPKAISQSVSVQAGSFPVTVGAGGVGGQSPCAGSNGGNSIFSTVISSGGGRGGQGGGPEPFGTSTSGGSGGGGGEQRCGSPGNVPPVSPPQGSDGGNSTSTAGAGGGGANASGDNTSSNAGANGGPGVASSITGSPVTRAGGGGGGTAGGGNGSGGPGGGGAGNSPVGGNGTANTGGGGGGGGSPGTQGGTGGSGIVILRYKYQ